MISVIGALLYSALGIFTLISRVIADIYFKKWVYEPFMFWSFKVFEPLVKTMMIGSFVFAIPYFVLNIIGMVKEKRKVPYLLCMGGTLLLTLVVSGVAASYY